MGRSRFYYTNTVEIGLDLQAGDASVQFRLRVPGAADAPDDGTEVVNVAMTEGTLRQMHHVLTRLLAQADSPSGLRQATQRVALVPPDERS